jgi:hypothetical protein
MKKILLNIIHSIKRRYYLIFKRKRYIQIEMRNCPFEYGDIVISFGQVELKYLEKNWYYNTIEKMTP